MINLLTSVTSNFLCFGAPFLFLALGAWGISMLFWEEKIKVAYIPFMNNQMGSFIFTSVLLLLPILGCIAGIYLSSAKLLAPEQFDEDWVLLPESRQHINKLRAADFYTVYAETTDGQLISCYYASKNEHDCWSEISKIPEIKEGNKCFAPPAPPLHVKVTDIILFENCIVYAGAESYNTSRYILSNDGKVYRSNYDDTEILPPSMQWKRNLFPITGLIVGLIIATMIVRANQKKNTLMAASG
jgi:hypothetical protein